MANGKPEAARDSRVVAVRLQPVESAALTELVNRANTTLEKPTATPANFVRRLILWADQNPIEPILSCCLPRGRAPKSEGGGAREKCQIEDERLLLEALLLMFTKEGVDEPALGRYRGGTLYRQYQTCGYLLDFAVLGADFRLAVEVDGPYHCTTRQAGVDRKRDRALAREGWRVLRFTTQEVIEDSQSCASEVTSLVDSLLSEPIPVETEPPLVNITRPSPSEPPPVGSTDPPEGASAPDFASLLDDIEVGSRVAPTTGLYVGVRGRVTRLVEGKATVEFRTAQGNVLTATLAVDQLQAL